MTPAEALRRALESDRLDLHTALPGRVRSYDAATQTADITLGTRRVIPALDDDDPDVVEDLPILPAVRVVWPRGGGYYLHAPLAEGDGVLVVVCESDLSQWLATGQPSDPGVSTRHGLSGAVAIPGLAWDGDRLAEATSDTLRVGREGGPVIEVKASTIEAGGAVALAEGPDVRTHLQAIAAALDALALILSTTSSYTYAAVVAGAPIDTTVIKGT